MGIQEKKGGSKPIIIQAQVVISFAYYIRCMSEPGYCHLTCSV